MSHIQKLIGQKVISVSHELSATAPFNARHKPAQVDLVLQIRFEHYILNIYNRHYTVGLVNISNLVGLQLSNITQSDSELKLSFDGRQINIDLSDSGFTGPESIALYGPDNLIEVWS